VLGLVRLTPICSIQIISDRIRLEFVECPFRHRSFLATTAPIQAASVMNDIPWVPMVLITASAEIPVRERLKAWIVFA
jgi:hypothetical protein